MQTHSEPVILLLLISATYVGPAISSESTPNTNPYDSISVWSQIGFEAGGAYSSIAQLPIEDCLRPEPVDCFSIQQNSWVSDSSGRMAFWVQNVLELAKLDGATYYGTFTFQIWNGTTRQPLACYPRSSQDLLCRAPFYTDVVPFPQTFTFYTHVSNNASNYQLVMANNLGALKWNIPLSTRCPCYVGWIPGSLTTWGHSPFELVAVGLDNSATAFFRNDTVGDLGPVLVQFPDGIWHETFTETLSCPLSGGCSSLLATGETSTNLAWNSATGRISWSDRADDQGVYLSSVSTLGTVSPLLPRPRLETYLYAEFRSSYAYLTLYDQDQKALGVDPLSGKRVEQIPNSSSFHDSSEDLLIVNPAGEYDLVITSGGNTGFDLFLSKATNTGDSIASRHFSGTLNIGYSERLRLVSESMGLSPETSKLAIEILPVAGIVAAILAFVGFIAAIVIVHRKHSVPEQQPI